MSNQLVTLVEAGNLFARNTLSSFIGQCNGIKGITEIILYILSGTSATSEETPELVYLPFYIQRQGIQYQEDNPKSIVRAERVPEYLTSVPYNRKDTEFRTPARFTDIDPREMFKDYALKSAFFIVQKGYDSRAYLRFHPQGRLELIALQTPERARNLPIQKEPFFLVA